MILGPQQPQAGQAFDLPFQPLDFPDSFGEQSLAVAGHTSADQVERCQQLS